MIRVQLFAHVHPLIPVYYVSHQLVNIVQIHLLSDHSCMLPLCYGLALVLRIDCCRISLGIENRLLPDGNYGFKSIHLINGGKILHSLLSMFKSMLIHGYNANDLVLSSIMSSPRDIRSSLSSSDNYRGICLFNGICTLFNYAYM